MLEPTKTSKLTYYLNVLTDQDVLLQEALAQDPAFKVVAAHHGTLHLIFEEFTKDFPEHRVSFSPSADPYSARAQLRMLASKIRRMLNV